MRPPDGREAPGGARPTPTSPALDLKSRTQATSEIRAAADIRDAATRLAIRTAGLGFVDFDDLLELVRATGRLCDIMVRASS
jgi:hypothetical protein